MKIDELSSVLYSADLHEGTAGVSVGWLGTETPATGAVDPGLVEAIAHLCDYHSINHYMGLHECELCRGHEAGADVNGRGNFGRLPLEVALTQGARALVELLLDFGADVKAKNREGFTMLEHAGRRKLDWLAKAPEMNDG